MLYKSATDDTVKTEHNQIKQEIKKLKNTKMLNKNETPHKFIQTMMDGKVTRIVSDRKSSSVCYICDPLTNPSNMNNLTQLLRKNICEENLCMDCTSFYIYNYYEVLFTYLL